MRSELIIGFDSDNTFSLDTIEGLNIPITKQVYSIQDPSKRLSDYTKTVSIPGSKKNDGIFKSLFDVNFHISDPQQLNPDFNPAKKAYCVYLQDEHIQIEGYCQLTDIIILENNKVNYNIVIYGQNADLFSKLGNLTLNDITGFGTLTWNDANIKASWLTPHAGTGVFYPLTNRGQAFMNRGPGPPPTNLVPWSVDYHSFKPWVYAKQLMDLIITNAGYQYESTFFDTQQFKSVIIETDVTKFSFTEAQRQDSKAQAVRNANQTVTFNTQTVGATMFNNQNWRPDTYVQDNLNQYDFTTGIITVARDGYHSLFSNIGYQYTAPANFPVAISNYVLLLRGGVYSVIWSDNITGMATTGTVNIASSIAISNKYLLAGDQISICTGRIVDSLGVLVTGLNLDFIGGIQTMGLLFYDEGKVPYGTAVNISDILFPMKQTDFFMGIVKMFNLYIEPDYRGVLTIEPRDDYYTENVTDWTTKLDTSKDFKISPEGLLTTKQIDFNYYQNDDDLTHIFNQTTGFIPGFKRVIFDNDFVKDIKKVDVPFICEPLQSQSNPDMVLIRTEYNGSLGEMSPAPMIAYAGEMEPCGYYRYYDAGSFFAFTPYSTYAYAGNLDSLTSPTYDLNFGPQPLYFWQKGGIVSKGITLFDQFHYNQWYQIGDRDSKLIECFMKLNAYDINQVSFRPVYWIDKAAYRLLEISDYNHNGETTTLCRFLKLNEIDDFIPDIDPVTNNGNNGGGGGHQGGGGGGDQMLVGNVLNGIWQGGPDNTIGANCMGCVITGSNNTIGDGCLNVIINGSDNIVAPGLVNVILKNCVGLQITESNLSYQDNVYEPRHYISETAPTDPIPRTGDVWYKITP